MSKEGTIEVKGEITDVLPSQTFKVILVETIQEVLDLILCD